ncbi:MAG TPA: (E)-4-hydroxy-3-methylbut-2-enyl-diphosphate synthase [Bacteroidales bacterium]|nr:(E)-4-hydroxy-3-methylbut-2-enyl-diphosphate synthase [Bacteroidales bacterium]
MNSCFFRRRFAHVVTIGDIPLGREYPVRVQSMANTLTNDFTASVAQCKRISDAGGEYVRFTVPSLSDADAFAEIKRQLRNSGYNTPLIADVHFNPDIALKVCETADKVRVNPGNFKDIQKFVELVRKCLENKVAIRIGVNHGSLSERIMDKYGDCPEGMAESAMEFLRICRQENFDQVVVSMKSSNVRVMIYATRLITERMDKEDMHFPLHLGVTEAGEGEDGRIKSAVGIGTLLAEGIGDTIRVSLTEEPEEEIPVARKIVESARVGEGESGRRGENQTRQGEESSKKVRRYEFQKRITRKVGNIGGGQVPVVVESDIIPGDILLTEVTKDTIENALKTREPGNDKKVLVYKADRENAYADLCGLRLLLEQMNNDLPVIFKLELKEKSTDDFMIRSAVCLGGAFIDGFGDGIWLENAYPFEKEFIHSVAFGILQACRTRMSRTEYISCPSCGRTNFNLIETVGRIKKATSHLKGLKIGVMGCIVNGPGEMADADYGYVGAGKGKITLYKAREIIKRAIPEENAVDELISLIKTNGDWTEPQG